MTMKELAERVEAATENMHVQLLWEAWGAVHGKPQPVAIDRWPGWRMPFRWDDFKAMVNAKAYLDAVLTLVPEGSGFELGSWEKAWARVFIGGSADETRFAEAATPALALCAAVLKARASQEQSQ